MWNNTFLAYFFINIADVSNAVTVTVTGLVWCENGKDGKFHLHTMEIVYLPSYHGNVCAVTHVHI